MLGRTDIEGSKRNVALDFWLPQTNYSCGDFSGAFYRKSAKPNGSIGLAVIVCIRSEEAKSAEVLSFMRFLYSLCSP
ncbi:unnamed protein product [Soboliphyme baturini]|uniref:Transposase n=1 Tax=Soboliphyme baturini TaxID=241478 RepID=A0A183IN75_9BILA|nr:unnamed protein product [Soboliphyme baturini]